jgi:hypothetical protein
VLGVKIAQRLAPSSARLRALLADGERLEPGIWLSQMPGIGRY